MRLVITGGGTGGHIGPGLAIAEAVRARAPQAEVLFVGSHGMERQVVPAAGWPFASVAARPLPRRLNLRSLWALTVLGAGGVQALALLGRFRPQVVVATGGYAAAPVGGAATVLRIPLVVQEQNLIPGVTNRVLGRWARVVSVSHESAARYFPGKVAVTGVPVRKLALGGDRARALARFGLVPDRPTLLVLGGSQGAQSLNDAVVQMCAHFGGSPSIQILHQTGEKHAHGVQEQLRRLDPGRGGPHPYQVVPFIDAMGDAYACADLVLCRAGAATLAELTANGCPAILVPYPYAASGHQETNAALLEAADGAIVIREADLTSRRLTDTIRGLLDHPVRLRAMAAASRALGRPDAASAVATLVIETASALRPEVARDRSG